jgi:acetylornithine deacetylase
MIDAGDRGHLVSTLQDLVRINSINPSLVPGAPGEVEIAGYVARWLRDAGVDAAIQETRPGRPSVVGRLPGRGGGPSLVLNAHLDTVGVSGMADPFSGELRDGRVYGRGAYDMKGSLAACLGVMARLRAHPPLRGDIILTAVADEEDASFGTSDLLPGITADAAIVTEPTGLDVCVAHKGFTWLEVETFGRAAHGSRPEDGVDAIMRMGQVLAHLKLVGERLQRQEPHPLLGSPSLHAATISGGSAPSTYAARCRLLIERRTLPGESSTTLLEEVGEILGVLSGTDQDFRAALRILLSRQPFEARADSSIVKLLTGEAVAVLGRTPAHVGQSFWMDAALFAEGGIDTVVIGPTGAGAHADVEWVDVESVVQLEEIVRRTAIAFCA